MTEPTGGPEGDNQPGLRMPESSVGQVLQRGGEELLLVKLGDRFTVKATAGAALEEPMAELPVVMTPGVAPMAMLEVQVEPEARDEVMTAVRATAGVAYASHVYQIHNDPVAVVYLTEELTLQFRAEVAAAAIAQLAAEFGLAQVQPIEGVPNGFVFRLTAAAIENPLKISNRLSQRAEVLVAEPNIVVRSQGFYRPRDPVYAQQWHLHHGGGRGLALNSHVFAESAWDITRGDRSIVVAVLDDAIEVNHPDFQGRGKVVAPRDLKEEDFLPLPGSPTDNHGTACAGVAIAEENGFGAVGIAPGCALMPVRMSGLLDDRAIETAFDWAVAQGAAVIACSWGAAAVNFPLSLRQRQALTRAATQGRNGKGCVIVFAAGNANRPINGVVNEQNWPQGALRGPTQWLNGFAVHPDVMAVAASTSLNRKAAYSNWGREIAVCAPSNNAPPGIGLPQVGYVLTPPEVRTGLQGLGIVTTDRPGQPGYGFGDFTGDFGGTSSACPLVAGVAALVLSANPALTAAAVRQILQQTADKIVDPNPEPQFGLRYGTYGPGGHSEWFGYGKVNAVRAVQAAVQQRTPAIAPQRQVQYRQTAQLAIPDNSATGVVSAIAVTDGGAIRDIQVTVELEHPFLGDLEVFLVPPNQAAILLQGRTLGRRTRYQETYSLATTPLLSRLVGERARGQWQLKVCDRAAGDVGVLQAWQLTLGV